MSSRFVCDSFFRAITRTTMIDGLAPLTGTIDENSNNNERDEIGLSQYEVSQSSRCRGVRRCVPISAWLAELKEVLASSETRALPRSSLRKTLTADRTSL